MVLTSTGKAIERELHAPMQASLFDVAETVCGTIDAPFQPLDDASSVLFQPGWLRGSERLFDRLRSSAPWRHVERPMYGRIVPVPRLICTLEVHELSHDDPLRQITTSLENALGTEFSRIGANFYRTGQDSVAWHRDRLGRNRQASTVVLVSLGAARTLTMRPFAAGASKTAETTATTRATVRRWRLGHGDLLVMAGACQRDWEHAVPKERGVGPRISLAFRSPEPAQGPHSTPPGVPPLCVSHKLR